MSFENLADFIQRRMRMSHIYQPETQLAAIFLPDMVPPIIRLVSVENSSLKSSLTGDWHSISSGGSHQLPTNISLSSDVKLDIVFRERDAERRICSGLNHWLLPV